MVVQPIDKAALADHVIDRTRRKRNDDGLVLTDPPEELTLLMTGQLAHRIQDQDEVPTGRQREVGRLTLGVEYVLRAVRLNCLEQVVAFRGVQVADNQNIGAAALRQKPQFRECVANRTSHLGVTRCDPLGKHAHAGCKLPTQQKRATIWLSLLNRFSHLTRIERRLNRNYET